MARGFRRGGGRPRTIPGPRVYVDYKDLTTLTRYLSPQGHILSRKRTGFTAQQQRILAALRSAAADAPFVSVRAAEAS